MTEFPSSAVATQPTEAKPQTVAEVLNAAARRIEAAGWYRPGHQRGQCVATAIANEAPSPDCGDLGDRARRAFCKTALRKVDTNWRDTVRSIIAWNDAPGREQSEVVAALRKAALLAGGQS